MGINWKSWFLTGLLAGVIVTIGGMVFAHFVLGPQFAETFFEKMGHRPTAATMWVHIGIRMGFGLVAMFVYVSIRPRYGPGPRSALIAAAVVYVSAYLTLIKALADFGVIHGGQVWANVVGGAVEISVATLAGARLYRERRTTT